MLGLREDLLVDELVHHFGDRLLLVGLLAEVRGYGHGVSRSGVGVCGRESCRKNNGARLLASAVAKMSQTPPEAAAPGAT